MFLRFVNNFLQRSVYANSHQIWLHWVKPPTESDENLLLKSPNCHLCMLGDFDAFKALWPIFLFYSLTLWVDRYLGSSNPLTRYVTTLCFPPEVWNSDNKRHRFFSLFHKRVHLRSRHIVPPLSISKVWVIAHKSIMGSTKSDKWGSLKPSQYA